MLNYNKLKYFIIVAKHCNISTAARELYIGQPALSAHIRELEEELGVSLFTRSNRGLVLTNAGKILYQEAAPFFDREAEIISKVRCAASEEQANIKIGLLGTSFISSFPDIIHNFHKQYPNVTVHTERKNMDSLIHALDKDQLHIGILITPGFSADTEDFFKNYETCTLKKGKLVAAMSDSHPLACRNAIHIEDLRNCPLVIQTKVESPMTYKFLVDECKKCGFFPNIYEEYPYIEPLLAAVSISELITITSDLAPLDTYHNIRVVPLQPEFSVNLDIIWKKSVVDTTTLLLIKYISESEIINAS